MSRRLLPIGIQTFRKIRERDYYYVDKTGFALHLIESGSHYFLSRPRRFGKSLFLDTLAELFVGNEPLFRGLCAHGRWDWERRSPMIRLSFGSGVVQSRAEFDRRILALLRKNQQALGVTCSDQDDIVGCFGELIEAASVSAGERAVVLVDEYDKPMLDNLTRPDVVREIRDGLRNLYLVRQLGALVQYWLRYPNLEVRASLNEAMLDRLAGQSPAIAENTARLYELLLANDFAGMKQLFAAFYDSIPSEWYTKNPTGQRIHLIGVEFSRKQLTLVGFEVETLSSE